MPTDRQGPTDDRRHTPAWLPALLVGALLLVGACSTPDKSQDAATHTHDGQEAERHAHEDWAAPPHAHDEPQAPHAHEEAGAAPHAHDNSDGTPHTGEHIEIPLETQQLVGIDVREVNRQPFPAILRVPGTVASVPTRTAEVVAPLWGRIEFADRPLAVGDTVRKDQLLAQVILELSALERHPLMDRTMEVEGRLREAEVRRDQAKEQHERAVRLAKVDPAYEREAQWRQQILSRAERELRLMQGQMERQHQVLKRRDPNTREVISPIAGTIVGIHFVPGDINPEGTFRKLFTIMDLSEVWVEASVFEKDASTLGRIQGSAITLGSNAEEGLPARLQAIGATVDPATRTLPVWFSVGNSRRLLRPGMPVEVRITLAQPKPALVVPAAALVRDRGSAAVFVAASPTQFERRPVSLGRTEGETVEILHGLSPGARVAVGGTYYIQRALLASQRPDVQGEHVH